MKRSLYTPEHEAFRQSFRTFLGREVEPHLSAWERAGIVPRDLFRRMGEEGYFGVAVPTEYGGSGAADFRFNAVISEELARIGAGGVALGPTLHADIVLPYFLSFTNAEQKARFLPGIASGELITAVAMTEPGIGSDLASMTTTATDAGDHYVVSGGKTFITNAINADLVVTAVKTDPTKRHAGISLLVLERGMEGFERGAKLEKIGQHAQDTAELFFHDVRVPKANLLGEEGKGFQYLIEKLPQERLSIALWGVAAARAALDWTLTYVRERKAFGKRIGEFQNTRFRLAEMATEVDIAETFIDRCVEALNAGELSVEDAAKAKYWCTELQGRVLDTCVQLHGGYGYMSEYPVARAYADARVTRIYGGTTEIMKEVIGRSLDV
jgi:alkylation response protein AidB-like acyl-CoA dehydrogenase